MKSVVIVDYGIGNLLSVARAFERCGASATVTGSADQLAHAKHLVLPGVGAFGDCVTSLRNRGLYEPVREYAQSGRPFLAICVGMQMLFDESEEFGSHQGFGLIPGRVIAIPTQCTDGGIRKVPHIGWNALVKSKGASDWNGSILSNTRQGESVYFVHSFAGRPAAPEHRLADCDYLGESLCAVVKSGNIYGCQFHPEKSGRVGLQMLTRFLEL